mmetsp:Transcript_6597/g.8378  ORF Transcript_6597/g.8378 Transcript_6597/m.8378 type:complete len:223 (+) Transcript_6597:308-976(+)
MDQDEDPFNPTPNEAGVHAFDSAFDEGPEEHHEDAFGEDLQDAGVEITGGEGYDAFPDQVDFGVDSSDQPNDELDAAEINHTGDNHEQAAVTIAEEPIKMEMQTESTALKEFEKEFSAKIAEKDEENKKMREEMKEIAAKELETFLKEYRNKCETKHSNNKQEEEEFTKKIRDADQGGSLNPWERIVNLVDVSENSMTEGREKDVTRLKNMLIQLKNSKIQN